jgi:hypothetical protein
MIKLRMESGIVALLLTALAGSAQAAAGSWDNLSQLAPGSEIRVVRAGGGTLRGFLQGATADSLAINATTSQETLLRPDIKRIELKRNGRRGRNALIGLLIGAGGGLAAGAAADHSSPDSWFPNIGKAILTPLGAIVGTIVGMVIPTGGWREIYRAP